MKRVLFIAPQSESIGSPVIQRMRAFVDFFQQNQVICDIISTPRSFLQLFSLLQAVCAKNYKNIFITMPPFRNWSLCFLPKINTILDIRDGWSIAIKSGYGGMHKPKKIKAWMAAKIERLAIQDASLVITCTPGLLAYFKKNTHKKELLFVPNGFSLRDLDYVQELRNKYRVSSNKQPNTLTYVCAGKFAEYGHDKAQLILRRIHERYPTRVNIVKIYGADYSENKSLIDFVKYQGISNVSIDLLPRLEKVALYHQILMADYGIAVIRDPDYDLGTKVFDYLICGTPLFNYFSKENNFTKYFNGYLDVQHDTNTLLPFSREEAVARVKDDLLAVLK